MCFLHHIVLYVAPNVSGFGGKRQYTWRQRSAGLGANVSTRGAKVQQVWGQTSRHLAPNVREFGGKRRYTWRQMSGSLGANVSTLGGKCQGVWGQTSVHLAANVREFRGKRQYTWTGFGKYTVFSPNSLFYSRYDVFLCKLSHYSARYSVTYIYKCDIIRRYSFVGILRMHSVFLL